MATLNDIGAVMHKYVVDKVFYQTFKKNAGLRLLMDATKKRMPAGNNFGYILQLGENPAVDWIAADATGVFSNNTSNSTVQATMDWKTLYYNTPVTHDDYVKAGGDSEVEIVNLFQTKASNTIATMIKKQSQQLYLSGYGAGNTLKMNGLEDVFSGMGVAYAGVTPVAGTNTEEWIATEIPAAGAGAVNAINYAELNNVISKLRANSDFYAEGAQTNTSDLEPDLILSNYAVQAQFTNTQQGNQVFNNNANLTAGYDAIKVNGLNWYVDSYCPGSAGAAADNHLYVLSKNSIRFGYRYGWDEQSPLAGSQNMPSQLVRNELGLMTGNFYCVKRNVNGRFVGIAT